MGVDRVNAINNSDAAVNIVDTVNDSDTINTLIQ